MTRVLDPPVPGVNPSRKTPMYITAVLGLLQKGHIAKCFKNEILLYQITFPRRKTSVVITASISSAPSAKITSALPFKSAILDEQRYLVPRPLISQLFRLKSIKGFQNTAVFPNWNEENLEENVVSLKLKRISAYICSTERDLVMNE